MIKQLFPLSFSRVKIGVTVHIPIPARAPKHVKTYFFISKWYAKKVLSGFEMPCKANAPKTNKIAGFLGSPLEQLLAPESRRGPFPHAKLRGTVHSGPRLKSGPRLHDTRYGPFRSAAGRFQKFTFCGFQVARIPKSMVRKCN